MLRNLFSSISVRLVGVYLLVATLALAVGAAGYVQIERIGNILATETTTRAEIRYLSTKIRVEVLQVSLLVESYVQAESPATRTRLATQLTDEFTSLDEFVRQLGRYSSSEAEQIALGEIDALIQTYVHQAEAVLAAPDSDNPLADVTAIRLAAFKLTRARLLQRLSDFEDEQTSRLYRSRQIVRETVTGALVIIIALTAVAIASSLLLGGWASSTISRPVNRLVEAAQRLASGDMSHRADVRSRSEIGLLATVFNDMASQLQTLVQSLENRLSELRQASARLELLHSLGQRLSQSLDLHEVAQRAIDGICQVVGARHGAVLIRQSQDWHLHIVGDSSYDAIRAEAIRQQFALEPGTGLAGWVAVHQQSALVNDVTQDERWLTLIGLDEWVRSAISVPLVTPKEPIGVLNIYSDQPGFFNESHLHLVESVAAVVAVALANARLYQETRRQLDELSTLHAIAAVAATAEDEDTLIEGATDVIGHSLHLDNFGILLLDAEGTALHFHPSYRGLPPELIQHAIPIGTGVTGAVAMSGTPCNLGNVSGEPSYVSLTGKMRSELCVPLKVGRRVIGVINAESSQPNAFTPSDERLMMTLAGQLATAIEKVRLLAETRRHAEELAAALARLEELDRLKDEFVQNVSHELRSPIALIQGYADLLAAGDLGELSQAQRGAVDIICRRTRMLSDLVKDITLILMAEARPLDREPLALEELVQAAVTDFGVIADGAGLTLRAEIEPGLPPVNGAPLYLRRVLDNLIGNAIKFTPAQGVITVRLRRQDHNVVLEVADTGIGIPVEEQERIFDRFYQIDSSSRRRYGGIGLGLALVKEIVEAHGGTVRLHSEKGQGSTFIVVLPALVESIGPTVPCAE